MQSWRKKKCVGWCCLRISFDARQRRPTSLYVGISSDLFALNVHAFSGCALHSFATHVYRVDRCYGRWLVRHIDKVPLQLTKHKFISTATLKSIQGWHISVDPRFIQWIPRVLPHGKCRSLRKSANDWAWLPHNQSKGSLIRFMNTIKRIVHLSSWIRKSRGKCLTIPLSYLTQISQTTQRV